MDRTNGIIFDKFLVDVGNYLPLLLVIHSNMSNLVVDWYKYPLLVLRLLYLFAVLTRQLHSMNIHDLFSSKVAQPWRRGFDTASANKRFWWIFISETLLSLSQIQSWWRGVMVRRQLGPYSKKKKKKGKKGKKVQERRKERRRSKIQTWSSFILSL